MTKSPGPTVTSCSMNRLTSRSTPFASQRAVKPSTSRTCIGMPRHMEITPLLGKSKLPAGQRAHKP
jgi:hypothetical protein